LCSTPFGITDVFTTKRNRNTKRNPTCSTPFGITDVFTSCRGQRAANLGQVLNAFRHHRCLHWVVLTGLAVAVLCSTPFGITDVFTAGAAW